MAVLRAITDTLIDALTKSAIPFRRVDRCTENEDADGIYLDRERAIFIDYESMPVICISLVEFMDVGGNVEIGSWLLHDGEPVESVVRAVKQI